MNEELLSEIQERPSNYSGKFISAKADGSVKLDGVFTHQELKDIISAMESD